MSDLELVAENCYRPKWRWTWNIRVLYAQRDATLDMLQRWCTSQFGAIGSTWSVRAGQQFYFQYKDDAMLFKLTWHGRHVD